jgi:hypothetical protein
VRATRMALARGATLCALSMRSCLTVNFNASNASHASLSCAGYSRPARSLSRLPALRITQASPRRASSRKLTPIQVLERLLARLEKRMEALQRVKLDGFQMVISELEN